jgi:dTDP-L-rhamnose 4-epimerase
MKIRESIESILIQSFGTIIYKFSINDYIWNILEITKNIMSNKILVTGGAGFIGSHIVDQLIHDGHEVRILDNLEKQVHKSKPEYINTQADFVKGDIRKYSDLHAGLEDIEIIFHEAAMVGVGQSMYQVNKYVDVNTLGTAKLLDYLIKKENSVKKLVIASSMSIYGEGAYHCEDHNAVFPSLRQENQLKNKDWDVLCPICKKNVDPISTPETKPLQPTSIYAISKKDQEEMALAIGRAYGIPTTALRYFNTYGPRQSLSNPYTGVCAIFSSRILNDHSPVVFEDGLQTRDFISVHDIVQANILAMEQSNANYQVFNVGSGSPVTITNISKTLATLYKKSIQPEITEKYRAGDIRHCFADISKISKTLGFKPRIKFEKGMMELVQWGLGQSTTDKFTHAYEELLKRGLVER